MTNEEYTINVQMLIRKPISEVFKAFIDPEITTNFWFTKSSGKLEQGKVITWFWEMYNVSAEVTVEKIVENKLIKFDWGDPMPKVEFEFSQINENATFVKIKNYGCKLTGKELIETVIGQAEGFTTVLDGLKAYLEYNIKLNLVGDKYVYGLNY
jgi:uncharacterized protein YndB with AHSA1/START domain